MNRYPPILCFVISLVLGWLVTSPSEIESEGENLPETRKIRGGQVSTNQEELSEVRKIAKLESYDQQVYQVIALASSIPIEEISEWHRKELMNGLEGDLETLFWRITSERWLEAAPKEFLDWAYMMNYRNADLYFSQWMEKSPEAAEKYLKKFSSYQRVGKLAQAISRIAKSNPEAALEMLSENIGQLGSNGDYYARRMISSLAKTDLEGLLKSRASWPEVVKRKVTPQIAFALFQNDYSKGLSFIQEENVSWRDLGRLGSQSERSKIADLLLKNRDSLPKGEFEKILGSAPNLFCSENSLELFLSSAEELGISESNYTSLFYSAKYIPLTSKNSAQFMEMINGESATLSRRQDILKMKISEWDPKDSEGLRTWLGILDDPDLHETADRGLKDFDANVEEAISKPGFDTDIEKILNGEEMGGYLQKRVSHWTPEETQKAVEAFRNLSQEEKVEVFGAATERLNRGEYNFDFYKEVYSENTAGIMTRDRHGTPRVISAFSRFVGDYSTEEPAKAAEWAAGLSPGGARNNAIYHVAKNWHGYSPSEVAEWIDSLPAADQTAAREALTSSQ